MVDVAEAALQRHLDLRTGIGGWHLRRPTSVLTMSAHFYTGIR